MFGIHPRKDINKPILHIFRKSEFKNYLEEENYELPLQIDTENYVNHIIDGMDVDSLVQMAYDLLLDAYKDCTEDEMIEEIKDLYDEDTLIDLIPDSQ